MKTPTLQKYLGVLAIGSFFILCLFFRPTPSSEKKLSISDFKVPPDSMYAWDIEMTLPPGEDHIPQEDLFDALQAMEGMSGTEGISNINWIEMGPTNIGGRTRTILIDANDATGNTLWAAGITGGLWKSTNGGDNWQVVDDFFGSLSISTIAQDPSNPDIIYFGTGEGWFQEIDAARGMGIWWTDDGGDNWSWLAHGIDGSLSLGRFDIFSHIQKLVVDTNGDLYAGTRLSGLMLLKGGGNSVNLWEKVVMPFFSPSVITEFVTDIEIAPDGTIYVGMFKNYSSTIHHLFKKPAGSSTWIEPNLFAPAGSALPGARIARMELACGPSLQPTGPSIIYVLASHLGAPAPFWGPGNCGLVGGHKVDGIYKSLDGGVTFSPVNTPVDVNPCVFPKFARAQAWYNLTIEVSPFDPNLVYCGGINLFRSFDGGQNWQQVSEENGNFSIQKVHADQHTIVFDPVNAGRMFFGNDGGVWFTNNGNVSLPTIPTIISKNNGYRVTQLYAVGPHPDEWEALAGSQDNNTVQYASSGLNTGAIANGTPGDGGYCFIDEDDPDYQFASFSRNYLFRSTDGGNTFNLFSAPQLTARKGLFINPSDYDSDYNMLFTTGDPNTIIRYANMTTTSSNNSSFTTLTIPSAILGSNSVYVTHIKVAPKDLPSDPITLFLGTQAPANGVGPGYIIKVENAETSNPTFSMINRTPPASNFVMPDLANVSCIEVEDGDLDHILVSFFNYDIPSVFETKDGGATWDNLDPSGAGLPNFPVRWVIFNPKDNEEALIATELGVWATDDIQGVNTVWTSVNTGLANVRVDMLRRRKWDDAIFAATHGRGLFRTDAFSTVMVNFSVGTQNPCLDQYISFVDQSSGATSWEWDLDNDGIVDATVQNPIGCPGSDATLTINGNITITKPLNITYNPQCASNDCVNGGGDGGARLANQVEGLTLTIAPNPFSTQTSITYQIPEAATVTLEIFDLKGRNVKTMLSETKQDAGLHQFRLGKRLASGIYFCVLHANGKQLSQKLVVQ